MSKEADKFSKFIEEKLNDFEVPYNESHWSEMSRKLDGMNPVSDSSSGLGKKFLWAGAAAVVAVSTWILLTKEKATENIIPKNENSVSITNSIPESKTEDLNKNIITDQHAEPSELVVEKTDEVIPQKEKKADNKIDKYAEHTEQKQREKSKIFVDNIDKEQKATFDAEPKINMELKTVILLEKEVFCVGDEVHFNIDREIEGAKYYWDFGDKDLKSRKPRPNHKFKKPGTFNVILYVAKGEIGDKNDYPAHKTVVVRPVPEVEIIQVNKQITLNDPYAEFEAKSDCICNFEWLFNEQISSSGEKVSFLIKDKGSYPVSLTAINDVGCSYSVNEFHNASKGVKMIVETGLTPDGNGNNDVFLPKELVISNVDFTFIVRDKSGRVIFQSNDKTRSWNGNLNNTGNPMPNGSYFWKVTFTDDRGKVHNQEGKISLLR